MIVFGGSGWHGRLVLHMCETHSMRCLPTSSQLKILLKKPIMHYSECPCTPSHAFRNNLYPVPRPTDAKQLNLLLLAEGEMRPLPTTLSHRQSQFCTNDGYRYPCFICGPPQIALRATARIHPNNRGSLLLPHGSTQLEAEPPSRRIPTPRFLFLNFGKFPLGAENFPIFGHQCA
jgi:hypothetical protein